MHGGVTHSHTLTHTHAGTYTYKLILVSKCTHINTQSRPSDSFMLIILARISSPIITSFAKLALKLCMSIFSKRFRSASANSKRLPFQVPRSTKLRKCCCMPMTLPGRMIRSHEIASVAVKPWCFIMCIAISVPVRPRPVYWFLCISVNVQVCTDVCVHLIHAPSLSMYVCMYVYTS